MEKKLSFAVLEKRGWGGGVQEPGEQKTSCWRGDLWDLKHSVQYRFSLHWLWWLYGSTCAGFFYWPMHWWPTLISENSLKDIINWVWLPSSISPGFCFRIHILSPSASKWRGTNIKPSPSLGLSRLCGTFLKPSLLTQRWLTSRRGRNSPSSRRAILTCGGEVFLNFLFRIAFIF